MLVGDFERAGSAGTKGLISWLPWRGSKKRQSAHEESTGQSCGRFNSLLGLAAEINPVHCPDPRNSWIKHEHMVQAVRFLDAYRSASCSKLRCRRLLRLVPGAEAAGSTGGPRRCCEGRFWCSLASQRRLTVSLIALRLSPAGGRQDRGRSSAPPTGIPPAA